MNSLNVNSDEAQKNGQTVEKDSIPDAPHWSE